MARISLFMPGTYAYATELNVRIQDINYGNHVGHDAFVSLLHEARIRYFNHLGYTESDIEGCAIVISDLAVIYKAQALHRDRLTCEIAAGDFNQYGCDIFYRMTHAVNHTLILEAKTGIVFFNYRENKITRMPRAFAKAVATVCSGHHPHHCPHQQTGDDAQGNGVAEDGAFPADRPHHGGGQGHLEGR